MREQHPTVAINVRLTTTLFDALTNRCKALTEETGIPHQRSDVLRLALAQYLGLITPAKQVSK